MYTALYSMPVASVNPIIMGGMCIPLPDTHHDPIRYKSTLYMMARTVFRHQMRYPLGTCIIATVAITDENSHSRGVETSPRDDSTAIEGVCALRHTSLYIRGQSFGCSPALLISAEIMSHCQ